ncbi:MAG: glycerol-3-phosphate 1-O-acyltransferase PlsY [Lachnospiraceae bacterium]|nr:glycerol-3-phosphate 1-O-acyltransferase PlsY [Lachnospiraceae bacterium]
MTERIISLVIGYLFGNFLTGYIVSKIKKVDIQNEGSGNVGTTNSYRVMGRKAGIIVLLGDVLKVVIATLIVWFIYKDTEPELSRLYMYYSAAGCVLGHCFPFFLKFKGGKGIACTAGLIVAVCPLAIPVCLIIFVGCVAITKYVSLGSVLVLISLFIQGLIFGYMGKIPVPAENTYEVYLLLLFVAVIGIVKHRSNIKRLLSGTENKFKI